MKRQSIEYEKVFTNHISDKKLKSQKYEGLTQHNSKKKKKKF